MSLLDVENKAAIQSLIPILALPTKRSTTNKTISSAIKNEKMMFLFFNLFRLLFSLVV